MGRPSLAPEKLLRAMLLQAFYSVWSERQLTERIDRPAVPLVCRHRIDDPVWTFDFSKNRDRLLEGEIAGKFLSASPWSSGCCRASTSRSTAR